MENVVVRDGDEELSLFLEMRRRENNVQCVSSLLPKPGAISVDKTSAKSLVTTTTSCVQLRRSAVEKFLDSENNKSDYEWLIAVPETLDEKETQENSIVKLKVPKAKSTALKPRVENIPQEPVTRSVKASTKPVPRMNSSAVISKQANTIAEPKPNRKPSRQATPTSRTTLPSTRQTNSARTSSTKSNPRASSAFTRSSSVGKSVPSAAKSASLTIREIPSRPASTSRVRANSSGDRSTGRSKISNDVNPVLMGTQMVERVVNMRKLPPPKQDDKTSSNFGRSLSRSSLDMALRHMNIRRSISGNLKVPNNSSTNSMDKNESSPLS
ncbi:unnamed protein product [Arabis nemorensis]|uniref:Uncharacterized protein n=1 Tax=Arabis nemorensis TaxID=586526 RepID=A0A565CE86_9BRAS|nr:unnamed protein product [Arabis nemorensis]